MQSKGGKAELDKQGGGGGVQEKNCGQKEIGS